MVAHASRTKLAAPRYVVRYRDRNSSEHRTVLAAMASALALVQAGHRSISVVDRRAAVVWRADRLGLTALLNLDRDCMLAVRRSAARNAFADSSWRSSRRP